MKYLSRSTPNPRIMSIMKYIFTPNYESYEGVRPINIYFLRVLYFLRFVGVGLEIVENAHHSSGPWDHTKAVAFCVWAAYPTLGLLGLIRPLRWLPIVIFMIFYKTLWVFVVAYLLWRAGTLAGSHAEEMAHVFVWSPVVGIFVPWVYVFKNYLKTDDKQIPKHTHRPASRDVWYLKSDSIMPYSTL